MTEGECNTTMNTHNTHSQSESEQRTPPHEDTDTETGEGPMNRFGFEGLAREHVAQLMKSDRGQVALRALSELLKNEGTWSLDAWNQEALASLLAMSIVTPRIRELVIDSVRDARIH
jgi:hypothetical protein